MVHRDSPCGPFRGSDCNLADFGPDCDIDYLLLHHGPFSNDFPLHRKESKNDYLYFSVGVGFPLGYSLRFCFDIMRIAVFLAVAAIRIRDREPGAVGNEGHHGAD